MGSDGKHPMKLRSLAHCSPPAVRPRFLTDRGRYRSTAHGLGTPGIEHAKFQSENTSQKRKGYKCVRVGLGDGKNGCHFPQDNCKVHIHSQI